MTAPLRALASAITTCLDAAKRALASANVADQQSKAAAKAAQDAQLLADTVRVMAQNSAMATLPSIASLTDGPLSNMADGRTYRVLDDGSGLAADFVWQAGTDHTDDGGIVRRLAAVPTGPGILKRIYEPVVRADWFGCTGVEGVEVSAAINKAVRSAMEFGHSALYIPPGVHSVDRGNPIILPGDFRLSGEYGRSTLKGIGTNWPSPPPWPQVGQAMICSGDPFTRNRYLTETSRVSRGSALTANLTVAGGAVTAGAIVAGGTGWIVGDTAYFGAYPAQAAFTITAVASYRGAAAAMTLKSGGAGWGAPANPVGLNFSTGGQGWDRVLDPATLGGPLSIENLRLDGNWGGSQGCALIPAGKTYKGLLLIGHSRARVKNLIVERMPNGGICFGDNVQWECTDNYTFDCGWTGYDGDRNAISNAGIYVTTNGPTLNSRKVMVARNRCFATRDSVIELHWLEGVFADNQIWDFGGAAFEGQASDYDTSGESFANNGGVVIPSDVVLENNRMDGMRYASQNWLTSTSPAWSDGTTARSMAVDGIGLYDGNEGTKTVRHNVLRNVLRRAVYAQQYIGGRVDVCDNRFYNIASQKPNIQTNAVCVVQAREIFFKRNTLKGDGDGGSPIQGQVFGNNGVGEVIEVEDNEFHDIGFGDILALTFYGGYASRVLKVNRNRVTNYWGSNFLNWTQTAGNFAALRRLEIVGNNLMDVGNNAGNANYATQAYYNITTAAGSTIDVMDADIRDNVYDTQSALHINAAAPIFNFNALSAAPWRNFNFAENTARGFVAGAAVPFTLLSFGAQHTLPQNLRVRANDPQPSAVVLADAATVAPNVGLATVFKWTLGGNRTLGNPLNARPGDRWTVEVSQDATGGRTLAFDTQYVGPSVSGLPFLSFAPNALDILQCEYDGTRVLVTKAGAGVVPAYTWAARPAANAVPAGTVIRITDVGVGEGIRLVSDGVIWRPLGRQLLAVGTPSTATPAGSTAANTLATVTIKSGLLGAGFALETREAWSLTNSANTKTVQVFYGAQVFRSSAITTQASFGDMLTIRNKTTASQVAYTSASVVSGGSGGALATGTVDSTVDQPLTFVAQCANAADGVTLAALEVWLVP